MRDDLQLNGMSYRTHSWIVVLVYTRLKSVSADRVLGAEAEGYGCGLPRSQRVEVEDCLRGCERELLQAAALIAGGFLLKGLQIFAEQIKAWGNTEVDHDHVGGFGKIVVDGCGGGGDIVLSKVCAVVCDIDGERIGRRLLFPWREVAADNLVGKRASAAEFQVDGLRLASVDSLEDELMNEVVVLCG